MSQPLLIAVAPNGARRGKADHPALPLTTAEIASVAAGCSRAGAGMLHLHVRDERGGHSLSAAGYQAAIAAVTETAGEDLLVQITTEACGVFDVAAQMAAVRDTRPAAASFAIREFFPAARVDPVVADFFGWVATAGIAAQFILYAPQEIERLVQLVEDGVIRVARPQALFVLGRHSTDQQSDPRDLCSFVDRWPPGWPWMVCAFGRSELAVATAAIGLGGHVRVGFENNLVDEQGALLAGNDTQVARVAAIAASLGRSLATPAQARLLFRGAPAR